MKNSVRTMLVVVLLAGFFGLGTKTVCADTDYERIVNRAYEDILGRKVDQGGMRYYRSKMIDEGWNEKNVRDDLRNSPEYKNQKVDLIIKRAYQDLLGRDPDRAGLELYRKRLIETGWEEEDVRRNLRESAEYASKH